MKTIIVFTFMCISMCLGAIGREPPNPYAGEGKCLSVFYPGLGEMTYGESKNVPGACIRMICNDNGGLTGQSCGSIGIPDYCILVKGDLSKPYPDCCPRLRC